MRAIDATICRTSRHLNEVPTATTSRVSMAAWLHQCATQATGRATVAPEAPLTG